MRFKVAGPLIAGVVIALIPVRSGLAASNLPPPAEAGGASGRSYIELVEQARKLAAEQSWERAKKIYLLSRDAAPDPRARQWSDLWAEDAAWRSELNRRWQGGPHWQAKHLAFYDDGREPYFDAMPKDDFWAALWTSRADLEKNLNLPEAWKHYAEVADYLGEQPPSAEASHRYVSFLQHAVGDQSQRMPAAFLLLQPHLASGAKIGATKDDRAWCAWQLARIDESPDSDNADIPAKLAAQEKRWRLAVESTAGSRWAPFVQAEAFLWRTLSGWAPDQSPDTPVNIPAILAELHRLRAALPDNPDALAKDVLTRLANLEQGLGTPHLQLGASPLYRPGEPVRFAYGAAGVGNLHITLDRLTPASWLAIPNNGFPRNYPPDKSRTVPGIEAVRDWRIDPPNPAHLAWQSQIIEAAPSLPPGLYLLTILGTRSDHGDPIFDQRKFIVSNLRALLVNSDAAGGQLFAYRADNGSPVANAEVRAMASVNNSAFTWEGTTDALGGSAVPPLPGFSSQVVTLVGDEPVCFSGLMLSGRNTALLFIDLYTDRPLFRPGETAHWKLIVRERRDGKFVIPPHDTGLDLQVELDDTILLGKTPLLLNDHGTAQGEIKIPDDVRPGEAELRIQRRPPDVQLVESAEIFTVDRFMPPAVTAKVELTGDASSLRPGREISARVTASYFSGGPVGGAAVHIVFSPADDAFWQWSENREQLLEWFRSIASSAWEGTTDANGLADFSAPLPAFLPESFPLKINASVQPSGAPAVRAETIAHISQSGMSLDPLGWTKARLMHPGERVKFPVVVRDGRGAPVAYEGRAQLMEVRWSEVWLDATGRIVPSDEVAALWRKNGNAATGWPDGWKLVHAGYTEFIAASNDVRAGADGRIDMEFTLPHAGLFRLQLINDQGVIISSPVPEYENTRIFDSKRWAENRAPDTDLRREVLSVVAADEQTGELALNPETAAILVAPPNGSERAVRVLGIVPATTSRAWVSLDAEDRVQILPAQLKSRLVWQSFAPPPTFFGRGTAELFCESSDFTRHEIARASFEVPTSSAELHIAIQPDRKETRPGDSAHLAISVHDPSGQPAADIELAVRVADEAVNSLAGPDALASSPTFFGVKQSAQASPLWSSAETEKVAVMRDPRNGAVLNPTGAAFAEDETIVLSPFVVNAEAGGLGYAASATLAGTRVATAIRSATSVFDLATLDKLKQQSPPRITLRRHFASTAFWSPDIITDANGEARVAFAYPDNLTQWRVGAYAVGHDGDSFGSASVFTHTTLPLQARLQVPRFLIAGDSLKASATLVNRTDRDLKATASLEISGAAASDRTSRPTHSNILVPKAAEAETAWPVRATSTGEARFSLSAQAGNEGDAMQLSVPVLEDGIQQEVVAVSRLAADSSSAGCSLVLPTPLDSARTNVSVDLSPNPACAILDALPYLIDYPYGCVEQTMSRFLPAIIAQKTFVDLGLDAAAVEKRILANEPPADALRRQKTAGLGRLDEVVDQSLARLTEAQSYNGFGWWPDAPSPDLWMTAYVVWGLGLAQSAGVELPDELRSRAGDALARLLSAESLVIDDRAAFAWAALANDPALDEHMTQQDMRRLFTQAFAAREKLSPYGRACLALAARKFGSASQSSTLIRNLDNGVQRATATNIGETAHWGSMRDYWRATDGAVESTALTLLALLELDPHNALVEPAVNWLLLNRRSSRWANTRETAFAALALTRYLQLRGRLDSAGEIELLANGKSVEHLKFDHNTLLGPPVRISIPAEDLHAGANKFELRRLAGGNTLYAVVSGSAWARSEGIRPASSVIEVARGFVRQQREPTLVGRVRTVPVPLADSGAAVAGDEVTVEIALDVPSELEYLMVEVPQPAGCEPLNPLSGWDARLVRTEDAKRRADSGDSVPESRPVYREARDEGSVFFIDHLDAGNWKIRFGLRATTVGDFRALPARASAMYVSEIRANSDARRVQISAAQ